MLPVVIYTFMTIAGFGIIMGQLAENRWRPVVVDSSFGGVFFTYVLIAGLYWWIIASVGWNFSTGLLVSWGAFSLGSAFYELYKYGGQKYTAANLVFSAIVTAVIVTGLVSSVV